MKRWLVIVTSCICVHGGLVAKTADGHAADIMGCLLATEKSSEARELIDYISQGMDMGSGVKPLDLSEKGSSYINTLRNDFGGTLEKLGKHREVAHWALDGSIPQEFLAKIDALVKEGLLPPSAREIALGRWREYVASRTAAVKQVFGLSGPGADRVARAYASVSHEIHNLGDYQTKDPTGLRSLDNIERNLQRSIHKLLGNNNELSKVVAEDLAKIPKSLPDKIRAKMMLDVLKEHGVELSTKIGNIFRRFGFSGTLKNINYMRIKEDLNDLRRIMALEWVKNAKGLEMTKWHVREIVRYGKKSYVIQKPVIIKNGKMISAEDYIKGSKHAVEEVKGLITSSSPKEIAKAATKSGVKTVVAKGGAALTEEIEVKGASNFTKFLRSSTGRGTMAGVVSFVISEGAASIEFSSGKISSDQFFQKTVFNAGMAAADGLAMWGVSVMLAGTPVGVAMGTMIGVGILINKAGEYVWFEIEKEYGVLPGVTDDDLLYELPENVQKRRAWTEDVDSDMHRRQREANRRLFDEDNKQEPWKSGSSFY